MNQGNYKRISQLRSDKGIFRIRSHLKLQSSKNALRWLAKYFQENIPGPEESYAKADKGFFHLLERGLKEA